MTDGRCDQHFVELFFTTAADEDGKGGQPSFWPLAMACIGGLVPAIAATLQRGMQVLLDAIGLNLWRLRARRLRGCRHLPRRSPPDAPR
jgi:hypothetical protein